METITFRAMDTDVQLIVVDKAQRHDDTIDDDVPLSNVRAALRKKMEDTAQQIRQLESLLSRFAATSEISAINRAAGMWVSISEPTARVLQLAKEAFAMSRGMFNPCLGTIMETFGYRETFGKIQSGSAQSTRSNIESKPVAVCPLELSDDGEHARLQPGFHLDLGGIGKSFIVEQAAAMLRRNGVANFVIDAGGDIVCVGDNDGRPWCVGIADPFHRGQTLVNLDVRSLAVATSGTYRRQWSHAGERVHHLIDPRTGRPSVSDLISCSVVHANLIEAEVLAKVALLLGTRLGIPWLSEQCPACWVIVTQSGEVIHSWK